MKDRLDDIEQIEIETQEPGVRIIDKTGPLSNFADRDHCLQYMTAIGLIFGELTADHYTDRFATDPRIDALREKMSVCENERFTREYYDLEKRAIGNSITVHFKDGSQTDRVEVQYPIGHRLRRKEGIPVLVDKFARATRGLFGAKDSERIVLAFENPSQLDATSASDFMSLLVREPAGVGRMLV